MSNRSNSDIYYGGDIYISDVDNISDLFLSNDIQDSAETAWDDSWNTSWTSNDNNNNDNNETINEDINENINRDTGRHDSPINPDNILQVRRYCVGSKTLDLGSGDTEIFHTTVDIDPRTDPNIVADVENGLPMFKDDSFDNVSAIHLLEHLDDDLSTLETMKRIAKYRVIIVVPIGHRDDPTHQREFSSKQDALDRYQPDHYTVSSMGPYYDLVMVWDLDEPI